MATVDVDVDERDLRALDAELSRAFETGDESGLEVLGYGEISSVVAFESRGRRWAGKRLPPLPDEAALVRYRDAFDAYLDVLSDRGLEPVVSRLITLDARDDGSHVVWCVQPVLPAGTLLPDVLRGVDPSRATLIVQRVLDTIGAVVDARTGLDGQLSNWAEVDGELRYLDVTTPMLRDPHGAELLDTDLFLASLPAPLRPLVRRFVLGSILDKYYDPRGVVLDLLGNLHKERLAEHVPTFLDVANGAVSPPITEREVRRYYADDARTWAVLQRLRRLDRLAHRALGRPYPFLLPGPIER